MGVVAFITAWETEKKKECTALKCPRVSARPSGAIKLEARYISHLRFSSYFTQIILCLLISTHRYGAVSEVTSVFIEIMDAVWQNADSCFSSTWHVQYALDFKHLHFFEVLPLLIFEKNSEV